MNCNYEPTCLIYLHARDSCPRDERECEVAEKYRQADKEEEEVRTIVRGLDWKVKLLKARMEKFKDGKDRRR